MITRILFATVVMLLSVHVFPYERIDPKEELLIKIAKSIETESRNMFYYGNFPKNCITPVQAELKILPTGEMVTTMELGTKDDSTDRQIINTIEDSVRPHIIEANSLFEDGTTFSIPILITNYDSESVDLPLCELKKM